MSAKKTADSPAEKQFKRHGLSLGLKLTLYLSFIVALVMGGITFIQRNIEFNYQHELHENLLRDSLIPLASSLETAVSIKELRHSIEQFHLAHKKRGHTNHEVILQNENGEIIISTFPENTNHDTNIFFTGSIRLLLPALDNRPATLTVLKDNTAYKRSINRQWLFWIFHLAITLLTITLFLYPAVYYLVTRPIKNLVRGIKKMEMGYWGKVPIKSGAWEIRWLAWRFENMISEVRNAVAHLMEAERKAQHLIFRSLGKKSGTSLENLDTMILPVTKDLNSPIYQELEKQCHLLKKASPGDSGSLELAEKAWQEYAPRADRLGYRDIKSRIENEALRLLDPEIYLKLDKKLAVMQDSMQEWAQKRIKNLSRALEARLIPYVNVSYRLKHTAGVWKKMQNKGLNLDEVYDLHAFRIIVPTESDCYTALGVIHQTFTPVIGRFKDYIAHPKKNGYQSLHTCVMPDAGPIFEIQIRSLAMHQHSESGTAAHWIYKTDSKNNIQAPAISHWQHKIRKIIKNWTGNLFIVSGALLFKSLF